MQLKEDLQTYWYNGPAIFIVEKCVALVTTEHIGIGKVPDKYILFSK